MREYRFYVYILASRSRTLYVGMTNNLVRRVIEHREGRVPGFTSRYRITRLVYFERYQYVYSAIAREKELKGWRRELKTRLIEENNPMWQDLSIDWLRDTPDPVYDRRGQDRAREADPSAPLRDDNREGTTN